MVAEGVRPVGDYPFERLAVAGITTIDGREVIPYGSVLPWRSVATHAPYILRGGESPAAAFERLLDEQVRDIENLRRHPPGALIIWAGDFNQSLQGPNRTGSTAGRQLLENALDQLSFTAWNRSMSHALPEFCAIDLICGPRHLELTGTDHINPVMNGRRISDHAGYVVELT